MAAQQDTTIEQMHREMWLASRARLLAECDRALDAWIDCTRSRPLVKSRLRALAAQLRIELGMGWSAA